MKFIILVDIKSSRLPMERWKSILTAQIANVVYAAGDSFDVYATYNEYEFHKVIPKNLNISPTLNAFLTYVDGNEKIRNIGPFPSIADANAYASKNCIEKYITQLLEFPKPG